MPDTDSNKGHYQSFIRKKHKISTTTKSNYSATKNLKHF